MPQTMDMGYLLHGAVHSSNPVAELLLFVLPMVAVAGMLGVYWLTQRQHRRPNSEEHAQDHHGDEPV